MYWRKSSFPSLAPGDSGCWERRARSELQKPKRSHDAVHVQRMAQQGAIHARRNGATLVPSSRCNRSLSAKRSTQTTAFVKPRGGRAAAAPAGIHVKDNCAPTDGAEMRTNIPMPNPSNPLCWSLRLEYIMRFEPSLLAQDTLSSSNLQDYFY